MPKRIGRAPVEVKITAPSDGHIPIYDGQNRLWNTISTSSLVFGSSSFANFAATASSADNFTVRGTLTAQTIVVQVITSSTELITGSLTVSGSLNALSGVTGSLFGTASFALSASRVNLADTSSGVLGGEPTYVPFFKTHTTLRPSVIYQVDNNFSTTSIAINQNNINADFPEALYVFQAIPTSVNTISANGNINNYLQSNIQNNNQGINASSDIVATANNGNEISNYVNMGINSENYASGFVGGPNDAYVYSFGQNMFLGNIASNGTHVSIFVGGSDVEAHNKLRLAPNNRHQMTGSLDISGSLIVRVGITGSLFGTSSWSERAVTASHATFSISSSNSQNSVSSSYALSASFSQNSLTSSRALSGNGGFTGSFSGSFVGNGSGITNISASNVVGLNLSAITSGSVTASVDPAYGFRVNSNTQITGSTTISGSLILSGSLRLRSNLGEAVFIDTNIVNLTASLFHSGSYSLNGVLNVTGSVTASLFGTSSWSDRAVTASHALNSLSSSFSSTSITSSFSVSSSRAITASFALSVSSSLISVSSSQATSASYAITADSSSQAISSSFAVNSVSSSLAITASHALTASSADNFTVRGTLTAQTIVAQVITSSTDFVTGSTRFGTQLSNTHQFTGSVTITGSLSVTGAPITGSLFGTSSWANQAISASFAISSSRSTTSSFALTASLLLGSIESASFAATASFANTASFLLGSIESASFAATASYVLRAVSASFSSTASYVLNAISASRAISAESSSFPITVTGSTLRSVSPQGGIGASSNSSIFFGNNAGQNATNANNSNFLGSFAGSSATNANNSNFLGSGAGFSASNANNSNFLGRNVGYNATNAQLSNFFGYDAGFNATNANNSNFLGAFAGEQATNANDSNFFGQFAGFNAFSASYSTLIGFQVGRRLSSNGISSNNIIIGTNITLENGRRDSINLGGLIFGTGSYFSATTQSSGSANGSIGINQPLPIFSLDVSGSGRYTNGLQVTGSLNASIITGSLFGTSSWSSNSITASYVLNAVSASVSSTASYVLNAVSASFSVSSSRSINADTASYVLNAVSASFASSGNGAFSGSFSGSLFGEFTGSLFGTASNSVSASRAVTSLSSSYALSASYSVSSSYAVSSSQAISASYAILASFAIQAQTASSADSFNVRNSLTASGLRYPTTDGAFSGQVIKTDAAGTLSFGDVNTLYETVRNGEANTLAKGTAVYVSGSQGATPLVYRADASTPSKMPVAFIIAEAIAAGASGRGITLGLLTGLDLTDLQSGNALWVDGNGTLTPNRPTGSSDIVQPIAYVTKGGNGGQINILNPGPVILPNLQNGYVWVGNSTNQPIAVTTSSINNVVSASHASFSVTSSYALLANTASFASNIANNLNITASNVLVTNNLAVNGTASFAYIQSVTGSAVIIGQEYVVLNTQTPASRFAGFLIYDSGSNSTSSIVWDSLRDHFVYSKSSGSTYAGGMFIAGPKNTGSLGSEDTLTQFFVPVAQGDDHIQDSQIYSSGSVTIVTGSLRATLGFTGSLFGTASQAISASLTVSASHASNSNTSSYGFFAISSSFSSTSSLALRGIVTASAVGSTLTFTKGDNSTFDVTILTGIATTASYVSSSNVDGPLGKNSVLSASFALTASFVPGVINNNQTASLSVLSSSYAVSASFSVSSSQAISSSFSTNSVSASYLSGSSAIVNNLTSSLDASIRNVRIGRGVLPATSTNIVIGSGSLLATASISGFSGVSNVAVGDLTLQGSDVGDGNTAIGYAALRRHTGSYSTAVGSFALWSAFGGRNTAFGQGALAFLVSGSTNTALGDASMLNTINGSNNTAVGNVALQSLRFGENNTAVGSGAMFSVFLSGSSNTVIGFNTGNGIVTGSANTIVGANVTGLPSTLNNNIILSDGLGNIRARYSSSIWTMSDSTVGDFTGSLQGTSSWANSAVTSSYALNSLSSSFSSTSSLTLRGIITASAAGSTITFTKGDNSTFGVTLSTANADTASYVFSSNVDGPLGKNSVLSSSYSISSSLAQSALTASFVLNAVSASYALSASLAQSALTASYVLNAVSASQAQNANTASYVLNAVSASFATLAQNANTASYVLNAVSASFATSASRAITSLSSSFASVSTSSSFASTASSADNFTVRGTLTAQTIVAQVITSSTDFVTGSTRFGTLLSNTHVFTGSVSVTGSLTVVGAGVTSSLFGTSSWAISSSRSVSSSFAISSSVAQFATTASYVLGSSIDGLSRIVSGTVEASVNVTDVLFTIQSESIALFSISSSRGVFHGESTQAFGLYSHAEGGNTQAIGDYSHAEGSGTISIGILSHTEGEATQAVGLSSHAEGTGAISSGSYSHAEGEYTQAIGYSSHAEGYYTVSSGSNSHAEGYYTVSSGSYSHAEGESTVAVGIASHAEGAATIASGSYSHVEGINTIALGDFSHAEGANTQAIGYSSHAEGTLTQAIGDSSHAEGYYTISSGSYSHAEGSNTQALGIYSHAEGFSAYAIGDYSHAEGDSTVAYGHFSHAQGIGTVASGSGQNVVGKYNTLNNVNSLFVIGNGSNFNNRQDLALFNQSNIVFSVPLTASFFFGTSSWANSSVSSSIAITSSFSLLSLSSSFSTSASRAITSLSSSTALTASYVLNAVSASFSTSASRAITSLSSSFSDSASYVLNAVSASFTTSSSFATTSSFASNFNVANQLRIDGTLTDYAIVLSSTIGSNNVFTQATSSFTSAFFKYTIATGSNSRAGEVVAVWNGSNVQFYDNSTVDIGNTQAVTSSVSIVGGDVQFNFQTNTSGWRIKSMATFI